MNVTHLDCGTMREITADGRPLAERWSIPRWSIPPWTPH
jgi:hypothetical protein